MGRGSTKALRRVPRRPRQSGPGRTGPREGGRTLPVTAIRYHEAAKDELLNEIGYLYLFPGSRE